ncbi:hypothetical protein H920_12907 [Fukomys damarensis]|uniref:Uncharacterized protein n=1 Tax=Fukomys damarensis TaxID=885580 RepID=A0A091DSL8_FUKDA|nr:hypothetical protein H920_12907 [Fukomys damarensis]
MQRENPGELGSLAEYCLALRVLTSFPRSTDLQVQLLACYSYLPCAPLSWTLKLYHPHPELHRITGLPHRGHQFLEHFDRLKGEELVEEAENGRRRKRWEEEEEEEGVGEEEEEDPGKEENGDEDEEVGASWSS